MAHGRVSPGRKGGTGKGAKSDPKVVPFRGGRMSGNTRKTNGFDAKPALRGIIFGDHFGFQMEQFPGSPHRWNPERESNRNAGSPHSETRKCIFPCPDRSCFTKKVNKTTFKKWIRKKSEVVSQKKLAKKASKRSNHF